MVRPVLVLALVAALAGCSAPGRVPTGPASTTDSSTGPDITVTGHRVAIPGVPGAEDRMNISCVSRTFCELVDETGLSWTWTGSAWTGPVRFAPEGDFSTQVSCPSTAFCMASTQTDTYVLRGTGWVRTPAVAWPQGVGRLSCAGPRYCLAGPATAAGTDVRAWHGTTWTAAPDSDTSTPLYGVDCAPGGDTCAQFGQWLTVHHGGAWSDPFRPRDSVQDVSCPTSSFCMAAVTDDYAVWSGGAWTEHPAENGVRLGRVACASAAFCLGVDKDTIAVWNGSRWRIGPPIPADLAGFLFDTARGIPSCPVDGWCMLMGPGVTYVYVA
jgi:hypothetical protein